MQIKTIFLCCFFFINIILTAQLRINENFETISDVVYKTVGKINLELDIYRPKIKDNYPTVVYLHGGNWDYGSKVEELEKYYSKIFDHLIGNNIVVVSVDYRLTSDSNHFPIPVIDGKDAIRFLRQNAEKFNINPERISLWGTSAGGHISQVIAFSDDSEFTGESSLTDHSAKVNLLIDSFGPVDMNKIFRTDYSSFKLFIAKIIYPNDYEGLLTISKHFSGFDYNDEHEKLIDFCSMYTTTNYVNKYSPPVLILHGEDDDIVSPEHSQLLKTKLEENEIDVSLKLYPGVLHSFKEASPDQIKDIAETMINQIRKYNP